jgi:hypothetical protein
VNFEVGKKYPTRGGSKSELLLIRKDDPTNRYIWLKDETETMDALPYGTNADGLWDEATEDEDDIISDKAIPDPVEVAIKQRFLNVYADGNAYGHGSLEEADRYKGINRIGVYELPANIFIVPRA